MPKVRLPVYGGVFFTAMSIILFQICLTRVFAVMMWHHFAPMVVSLALLGFGASGSLLTSMREGEKTDAPEGRLTTWSTLYAIGLLLGFCFVTLIRVDSLDIGDPANILGLLFCYLVISVPFLFGGLAIGTALSRYPEKVGQVYFADLIGSGLGGAAAAVLLGRIGATPTVMVSGLIAFAGAFCFSLCRSPGRMILQGGMLAVSAALVIGFCGGGLGIGAMDWKVPFAKDKYAGAPNHLAGEKSFPSAVAQVDVSGPFPHDMAIGGHFGDVDLQEGVMLRGVTQDGTAPTALFENASDLSQFPSLDDTQAASAYVAMKAAGRSKPEVLAIGVGGGIDIMIALFHDAKKVTGVELNAAMVKMVTEDYADYIGKLFKDERVRLVNEEGRSFLRRGEDKYDLIQMSGVDTYTALSLGAQTLGESYLYTVEAVKDFYEHLNEGGYINYSRFLMTHPKKPRETIRLANTAWVALSELGVEDPASKILVLQAHGWASTIIKRGDFTKAEVEELRQWAAREHFMGLAFDPLRKEGDPLETGRFHIRELYPAARLQLKTVLSTVPGGAKLEVPKEWVHLQASALRDGAEGLKERAIATTDELVAKFPGQFGEALKPLLLQGLEASVGQRNSDPRFEHFAGVQRDFFTLLRSPPTEREKFIEEYVYDLEPARDDKPFFFDYFRWRSLLDRETWGEQKTSGWHPNFPVGHAVLLVSLLQIVVLGVVFILMPIRHLRQEGVRTTNRFRYFLYFTALGMGFMFIEISLMQKFVLFLGNPTYSLSVVLAGVLVSSGLGALVSSRIPRASRGALYAVLLAILLVIALDVWVVNELLQSLLGLALWQRIAVTLGVMGVTGFFLGMAFPLGIRVVKSHDPVLIPWGWAVNGFLSVFSSLAAIVVAQVLGFTWVLMIAGGVYALGILPMLSERVSPAESAGEGTA